MPSVRRSGVWKIFAPILAREDIPMTSASYPVDATNQLKRRHDRGFYDHDTVHKLLDAAVLCHVSYVIDGAPYCTPTLFWREGSTLYWHGSSASRMLRNQSKGQAACLTVTHLDSLVLARSGFNHSADYRSVMAFGQARLLDDPAEKAAALVAVVAMVIERASAKIRARGVVDEDEDYALPIYAERLPVQTVIGAPEPCPRLLTGVTRPAALDGYRAGRALEDALREAHAASFSKA